MTNQLSLETITLVKQSVPALIVHGGRITEVMYDRLFQDEQVKSLFNLANQGRNGSQVQALAAAIRGYAENIENLASLAPLVERIAHKHIAYHILPEHYEFVARALLGAISEVLGEAATPAILNAWGEAFWFLADILKDRESGLRLDLETREGGWHGWRDFTVAEKIKESEVVTSFILRPVDGGQVLKHKPGQYLTLRFQMSDELQVKRNYSVSCSPNSEYYRISVKREDNGKGGSRTLHSMSVGTQIQSTPPSGDFFLDAKPEGPIVLVSGGVGLTPMVSMLETIAEQHPQVETHFVHGALNSSVHAMDLHVRSLILGLDHARISTFYSNPLNDDVAGVTHDYDGYVTAEWLRHHTSIEHAQYFLCGPKPFLRSLVPGLLQLGVPRDHLHYEFFGPADELFNLDQ